MIYMGYLLQSQASISTAPGGATERWSIGQCFLSVVAMVLVLGNIQEALAQPREIPPYHFENLTKQAEISIAAAGDLMLGSHVISVIKARGVYYPFAATSSHLKSADVAIVNLEAPFTERGTPFEKKFNFKVPPEFAKGLQLSGIDVVNLANNHILDFGKEGLISTMITLDTVDVKYSGAGMNLEHAHKPAIVERRGKKIAFFGYSMTFPTEFYATANSSGTAYPEPELMQRTIAAWRDSVDFIVTSFHWSAELADTPKPYQIEFAHYAIDSGADLVLGHHPHILQGLEIYKNRLIAYSLGNYAFGSYSQQAVDSIILKVYLRKEGLYSAHCVPINVDNIEVEFQPQVLEGKRRQNVISTLNKLSRPLNDGKELVADTGLILGDWSNFYSANFNGKASAAASDSTGAWPAVETMAADSSASGLIVR